MPRAFLEIAVRPIGPGHPTYIVAEISANQYQRLEQAVQFIHAVKDAGADAVKLQTYTPDTMTIQSNAELFQIQGGILWDGRTRYNSELENKE